MIALLALARKIIILDFSATDAERLAALGFMVLVWGIVYYLLKRSSTLVSAEQTSIDQTHHNEAS